MPKKKTKAKPGGICLLCGRKLSGDEGGDTCARCGFAQLEAKRRWGGRYITVHHGIVNRAERRKSAKEARRKVVA